MITVHKAQLEMTGRPQRVQMQEDSKILCVQAQYDKPCIWYLCDTHKLHVERTFVLIGTGHTAPTGAEGDYVGTVQNMGGGLVLHLFEVR